MWPFLGRTTGNLTLSGMLARFRRPPTLKIPLQSTKGSSLKRGLQLFREDFLSEFHGLSLGFSSFWIEVRALISSSK